MDNDVKVLERIYDRCLAMLPMSVIGTKRTCKPR